MCWHCMSDRLAGQGRAGQGRAGQGRAGHGRARQGRAGQRRSEQGWVWAGAKLGRGRECKLGHDTSTMKHRSKLTNVQLSQFHEAVDQVIATVYPTSR